MVNVAPTRTLEETIAWEVAHLGQHRPEGEWSAGANVNDCALFQSDALGHRLAIWNVDGFKTATGGTYHRGKAGLRRGDVVLFDWNGDGGGNHTEMATTAPDAAGNFQTIGANSSARADHGVAYNIRNGYVLGYFRPAYKTPAATAAKPTKTATSNRTDDDEMLSAEAQSWLKTEVVNKIADDVRRDSRYRLYYNTETKKYFAINHNLPSLDPAKIAYFVDETQAQHWFSPYEFLGDSPAQAQQVTSAQQATLEGMARGTDSAYTKK